MECLCPGPCPTLKMCVSCTRNLCFTNATRASKTMKLILKATLLDLTLGPPVVKLHKTVCETMRPHMCSHCVHTVFTLCPPMCPQNASISRAKTSFGASLVGQSGCKQGFMHLLGDFWADPGFMPVACGTPQVQIMPVWLKAAQRERQ